MIVLGEKLSLHDCIGGSVIILACIANQLNIINYIINRFNTLTKKI
jgi:hypothetical protein